MSLAQYRSSPAEQQRTADLLRLMPSGHTALDIGARDGYFSLLLADRFQEVFALDLVKPQISHPRIRCVEGNAARLDFPDRSIDFVFCAEVLEHIPPSSLAATCREIERVAKSQILIGVPYQQDIRVGRSTCYSCRGKNPPWGHVNSFDEQRLNELFPGCRPESLSFVGLTSERTNEVSRVLMDLAGNPYGTYSQEEPCIHCGHALLPPPDRNVVQLVLTRLAFMARNATGRFARPRGNWIHVLLSRADRSASVASPRPSQRGSADGEKLKSAAGGS